MTKHQFLSESWIEEARRLRSVHSELKPPAAPPVRMNLVVTGAPVSDGTVEAYLDTSGGTPDIELGRLDNAEATVTVPYALAKSVFVEGNLSAAMEGLQLGRIQVQGDMMKLMALAGLNADPGSIALARDIKAMTAE